MLRSRFDEIARDLPDRLDEAAEEIAEAVANDARVRAPFDTGALKKSIRVDKDRDGHWRVLAGDSKAWYAHLIEYGGVWEASPHPAAEPFLTPAVEAHRFRVRELVRRQLRDL